MPTLSPHHRTIRIGFIPLLDAAPLIAASALGIFAEYGLNVKLEREVGWATIRDKILFGELEAAHAPAGMVVAATCGLGSPAVDCLTACVLNLHGNAIVLSRQLQRVGVDDGHTLREYIRKTGEQPTFGVVYQWSSHNVLLREWLRSHGLDPDRDVQIVVVPPSQVFANLRAGHLDGYCVGEPWASLAEHHRFGWVTARSAELAPMHPEKVLMVKSDYAVKHHDEHLQLVAAIREACAFCEAEENREDLIRLLARPEYVGVPAEVLRMAIGKPFNLFASGGANEPTADKASWVTQGLVRSGLVPSLPADIASRCFRSDLFAASRKQPKTPITI